MIDITTCIAALLEPMGAQFEISYEDISADFPLIVFTEIENKASIIVEGEEFYSSVAFQLDVYGHTVKYVNDLCCEISEILTKAGFRRTLAQWITEKGMKRRMLQFNGGIDNKNRVYKGSDSI